MNAFLLAAVLAPGADLAGNDVPTADLAGNCTVCAPSETLKTTSGRTIRWTGSAWVYADSEPQAAPETPRPFAGSTPGTTARPVAPPSTSFTGAGLPMALTPTGALRVAPFGDTNCAAPG